MSILYVNPSRGNDSASGSQSAPLKTIARALQKATSATTIQLTLGTYSNTSGERFPLIVPSGVKLIGNEGTKGSGIIILGSGRHSIPVWAVQNIGIVLENGAELRGVTVANSASRGTAVWIDSTAPTVANNTFSNSAREGVFVSGTAKPLIEDNVFADNAANGISYTGNGKGEVLRNIFQRTGYGINISDGAAPLIANNRIANNRSGILIAGEARPVLRNNIIEKNSQDGVTAIASALPDLGSSADPAGNVFRDNGQYDLQSTSTETIIAAGNNLRSSRVKGNVELVASEVDGGAGGSEGGSSGGGTQPPTDTGDLTDIRGHWAAAFIMGMVNKGLISGFPDKTFKPDAPLTRVQYAAIAAKAFNESQSQTAKKFYDVRSDFWGFNAIVKANRMGFISGFPDGSFRPAQNLTRVQALVSLVGGLKLTGGRTSHLGFYSDRAQIPSYATDEIVTATEKRIVVNYPNRNLLEPMQDITRAEASALIYQALVARGLATAIDSSYIVEAPDVLPDLSLSDVKGHWAETFITRLYDRGIISGFQDGTFRPDASINRVSYAALLANAFKPVAKRPAANFADVPQSFWGFGVVQQAYRAGFISGFPDMTFRPNENLQRVQAIISLANGLGLSGGSSSLLNKYADKNAIPAYARTSVANATQNKIVVNYPNRSRLEPSREATRAEVAAMVYQALVNAGKISAIDSPYIVRP